MIFSFGSTVLRSCEAPHTFSNLAANLAGKSFILVAANPRYRSLGKSAIDERSSNGVVERLQLSPKNPSWRAG